MTGGPPVALTWTKTIPSVLADPAIGLLAISLVAITGAACSSDSINADEIVAGSREAMGQLTSYQWSSIHNTVRDGRFGALTTTRTSRYIGAWDSNGRVQTTWLGSDGQSSSAGFFRRTTQIGGQEVREFSNREFFASRPALPPLESQMVELEETGRIWTRGPDSVIDGHSLYTIESAGAEATGPRPGDLEGPVGQRNTATTYYIDPDTFRVTRKINQTRSELPVLGLGGTELQSSLTSVNTTYFGFDEPVEIEFPEGFDPLEDLP